MNQPCSPSRDLFVKVWDLHNRIQAHDIELLSLEAENPEHAARARTIMDLRDNLWREKCIVTDRFAEDAVKSKKRKLGARNHADVAEDEPKSSSRKIKKSKRKASARMVIDLDESDYDDDNNSQYGAIGDDEAGMNGGVAIPLDSETQHAMELQSQIQAELYPPQAPNVVAQNNEEGGNDDDLELMEIDAATFNAASEKNALQRENMQLRKRMEKTEKWAKLIKPLVIVGIHIRRRHLEHVGARHIFGGKNQRTIMEGNEVAHEANILADMALLDELGEAGTRYLPILNKMYRSTWSPKAIPGWEDIRWDDRNCELLSIQATCRQDGIDERILQPELGAVLARIKILVDSVDSGVPTLFCPIKRAKINSDPEVERLLRELRGFLKPNQRHRRKSYTLNRPAV